MEVGNVKTQYLRKILKFIRLNRLQIKIFLTCQKAIQLFFFLKKMYRLRYKSYDTVFTLEYKAVDNFPFIKWCITMPSWQNKYLLPFAILFIELTQQKIILKGMEEKQIGKVIYKHWKITILKMNEPF